MLSLAAVGSRRPIRFSDLDCLVQESSCHRHCPILSTMRVHALAPEDSTLGDLALYLQPCFAQTDAVEDTGLIGSYAVVSLLARHQIGMATGLRFLHFMLTLLSITIVRVPMQAGVEASTLLPPCTSERQSAIACDRWCQLLVNLHKK